MPVLYWLQLPTTQIQIAQMASGSGDCNTELTGKDPGLDFVGPTTVVTALEKTKQSTHVHALGFLITPTKWGKQQLFTQTHFQGFMSVLIACSI